MTLSTSTEGVCVFVPIALTDGLRERKLELINEEVFEQDKIEYDAAEEAVMVRAVTFDVLRKVCEIATANVVDHYFDAVFDPRRS